MKFLLDQVFSLLISSTGSLTYHFVLAFSIVGAISNYIGNIQQNKCTRFWRAFGGLVILLAFQLGLFLSSGLAWQGIIDGNLWLPLLDRAVTLISLIVIVWLWTFPDPFPYVDFGFLLLALFTSVAFIFSFPWWWSQEIATHLNGLPLDRAIQTICILVSTIGCIILIIRKPDGWGIGLIMLFIMLIGFVFHLFLFQPGNDFPGAVRLAQMVAYPFLLIYPQCTSFSSKERHHVDVESANGFVQSIGQKTQGNMSFGDSQFWKFLNRLNKEKEIEEGYKGVTKIIAQTTRADLCLLVNPPAENGSIIIQYGYDSNKQQYIDPILLDHRSIPALASSLRLGRPRYLVSGSTSPDMINLARALDVESTGNILSIPIQSQTGEVFLSVVVLSPISKRSWTQEDQGFLMDLSIFLVYFLQHSREMQDLQEEIDLMRQTVRNTQDQLKLAFEERQRLYNKLTALGTKNQTDLTHPVSLEEIGSNNEDTYRAVEQLLLANQWFSTSNNNMIEDKRLHNVTIPGELRLALEEIAFLNSALAEADSEIQSLRHKALESVPTDDQIDTLVSIAQDLRHPLSSIVGYTDFLLSESTNPLSEIQRKYLERIKVSTKRISRLVDDLNQIASLKGSPIKAEYTEINFEKIINQIIKECIPQSRGKHISINPLLLDQSLEMVSDEEALRKIIKTLLQNAISASPSGGEITIRAQLEKIEGQPDYMLIQVVDSGSGISPEDLPNVFLQRSKDTPIAGLGEIAVDLTSVKAMVEVLVGRVWVDSELGQGTTFSILLPITTTADNERNATKEPV